MSSIAPISAPPNGAVPASTPGAEALSRPPAGALSPEAARQTNEAHAQQAAAEQARSKPTASELQKQIDQALADSRVQTNLRFRVDEDANRIVVSVVDSDTGETIVQIPDEAALAVARRLAATGRGLLDREA
ncbi:flagellar protein FlaG [Thermomonas fusca]|uniref:Flagellar protein FlaG n=1 Tax=Thermomonas fusca TaxID=215690 RepID=A0A5R9PD61_9GAMM|nr:flagellar protein FlaG [Thermomonas fusca]TLX21415.1 flagellar protein FlaG [Thermomonas fusca]